LKYQDYFQHLLFCNQQVYAPLPPQLLRKLAALALAFSAQVIEQTLSLRRQNQRPQMTRIVGPHSGPGSFSQLFVVRVRAAFKPPRCGACCHACGHGRGGPERQGWHPKTRLRRALETPFANL
jgi:hypothetical protein